MKSYINWLLCIWAGAGILVVVALPPFLDFLPTIVFYIVGFVLAAIWFITFWVIVGLSGEV